MIGSVAAVATESNSVATENNSAVPSTVVWTAAQRAQLDIESGDEGLEDFGIERKPTWVEVVRRKKKLGGCASSCCTTPNTGRFTTTVPSPNPTNGPSTRDAERCQVDDFGLENPTRTFLGAEMKFEERLMREKKPVKGVAALPTPTTGRDTTTVPTPAPTKSVDICSVGIGESGGVEVVVGLTFQATDVKKALTAVWRICEKGNIVQFGGSPEDCFI